jgi:hypothetical protein
MKITKAALLDAVIRYSAQQVDDLAFIEDPKVAGTFAIRATTCGFASYYLICHASSAASVDELVDMIEEADFTEWPPKSGALKFI